MSKYIEAEGVMRACYDSFLKTGNKAYSEIIALADAVPAADVVEVRHGRWEWNESIKTEDMDGWFIDEQGYVCSECGFIGVDNFNYCPNCGAKMVNEDE